MAFFEDIAVRLGLDPKDLRAGQRRALKDLREIKRAAEDVGSGMNTIADGFRTFGRSVTVVTSAVTGLTAAFFGLTASASEAADQAGKAAQRTGLTVREYGRLAHAAKMADIDTQEFGATFVKFNKQVIEAQQGNKEALENFRKIGVRIRSADGSFRDLNIALFDNRGRALSSAKVLEQVAQNFSLVADGSEKTANAVNLFGKSGAKMIPLLNEGVGGLKALGDEAERLGVVFTDQQAKVGDEFGDAIDRTKASLIGLRNQIGITFAPDITRLADELTDKIVQNRDAIVDGAVEGYILARQTALDFFNVFSGNEADVSQQWVLDFAKSVREIGAAIQTTFQDILIPAFEQAKAVLEDVARGINEVFGTNLTATDLAVAGLTARLLGFFTVIAGAIQTLVPLISLLGKTISLVLIRPLLAIATSGPVLGFFAKLGTVIASAVTALAAVIGWPATIAIGVVAAGATIFAFWDDIKAAATDTYNFIVGLFSRIADGVRRAIDIGKDFVGGFTGTQESGTIPLRRRSGGSVPGSGSGDIVPALLEPKEFVMRRLAVQKYGQPFMDALNRGQVPRFSEGGMVGGGTPVNLHLGDATFPMQAAQNVVDDLTRHVRATGRRSPGSAPSWKR